MNSAGSAAARPSATRPETIRPAPGNGRFHHHGVRSLTGMRAATVGPRTTRRNRDENPRRTAGCATCEALRSVLARRVPIRIMKRGGPGHSDRAPHGAIMSDQQHGRDGGHPGDEAPADPADHHAKDAELVDGDHGEEAGHPGQIARPEENLPTTVLALPLNQRPVFPTMMLPLVVPPGRLPAAVKHAIEHQGGWIAFFLPRQTLAESTNYRFEDLHPMGSLARVLKHQEVEGG